MSKWMRARMAIACGADLVVELPALYAVRTADAFARGGVDILGGIGADYLSFGSETADMHLLERLADLREEEPPTVEERIRSLLDSGMSHARARGMAVGEHLNVDAEMLNRPNLILATEYIRAIRRHHPAMQPVAVSRIGGYHDAALGEFASASAIRSAFASGDEQGALDCLPEAVRSFAAFDRMHPMDDLLMYRLRSMTMEQMAQLPDVREGLESRLYRLSRETGTAEALLEALKCKRYTHVRLSRMLAHGLLGMTQDMTDRYPAPDYARIIAMHEDAGPLLKEISSRATIPIVSNARQLKDHPVFELECRATDIWALLHDDPEKRLPGREFTEKFIRVSENANTAAQSRR